MSSPRRVAPRPTIQQPTPRADRPDSPDSTSRAVRTDSPEGTGHAARSEAVDAVDAVDPMAPPEMTYTQCRQCGTEIAGLDGRYACPGCGWVNDHSEGHRPLPLAEDDPDFPRIG
ncbi:hypothetical protein [Streptomyces sp. DT171]|uniref:hypothetical protein n=1 Tax=Streptomyces sp. DT171 TaxID=3416524 RepID=UPI003CECD98D